MPLQNKMKTVSVSIVRDDGYAAQLGIQPQDIIYKINGNKISDPEAVTDAVSSGESTFELIRDNLTLTVNVKSSRLGVVLAQVEFDEDRWLVERAISRIPICTAPELPGWHIEDVLGMVGSQCVLGVGFMADISAGIRDVVGGRSKALESRIEQARGTVGKELQTAAHAIGGSALISVSVSHTEIGDKGGFMLMITATGTAVVAKKR